jgi:hypothetical protein
LFWVMRSGFGLWWLYSWLVVVVVMLGRPRSTPGSSRRCSVRSSQFQVDDFSRRMVGADPNVSALTKLLRDNADTLTPEPLYALVHYSHPPLPVRVAHRTPGRALEPDQAERNRDNGFRHGLDM